MGYEVVTTAEFEACLNEAVSFRIENYGMRSARRLLDAVDSSTELLSTMPAMGHYVDRDSNALAPDALRWIRIDNYFAVYRVITREEVVVLLKLFFATSNWRRRVLG